MNRMSTNELAADGTIRNGYDYNVQVWVEDGICLAVGYGRDWAGMPIREVPGHEVRGHEDYNAEDYARAVWADALAKGE